MNDEHLHRIRRDGVELGAWDKFTLRQCIAAGSIFPSDEVFLEEDGGKWVPLVPPYRRKYVVFDWAGEDDLPWFYVKDGAIHGPRHLDEIAALCEVGVLTPEAPVTHVGAEKWSTVAELLSSLPEDEPGAIECANASVQRWVSGDYIGAGIEGAKAVGKFWKKLIEAPPITSERLYLTLDEQRPSLGEILAYAQKQGIAIVRHEKIKVRDADFLELNFDSVATASAARDLLELKRIGGKGPLLVWDHGQLQP